VFPIIWLISVFAESSILQIVEFDTPLRLIQKEGGVFRTMCLKSGTFSDLEATALAKAERTVW
jgi:hypothetical protein